MIPNKMLLLILVLIGIVLASACSYDSEKAILNRDVVNMHGPIYNYPVFESFLENKEKKEAATVRIANYTLEGDLTVYKLVYDGSSIDMKIDRSKNKNRGNDAAKTNMTCTDLVEEEGQQLFVYTLTGCDSSSESFTILSVAKELVEEHVH